MKYVVSSALPQFSFSLVLSALSLGACQTPTVQNVSDEAQAGASALQEDTPAPSENAESNTNVEAPAGPLADGLKVVSWNIEWLSAEDNSGHNPRNSADYERLRSYVDRLDADVFVLQEVDGEEAARHVFGEDDWDMHFVDQNRAQLVGVVWRRGIPVTVNSDFVDLDVGGVRAGADVTIGESGSQLRILGVHLKSGCWGDDYRSVDSNACDKLERQLPILESWVEARAIEGVPFMVVGDFNRRLSASDIFYQDLNDGDPASLQLHLPTDGHRQQCWGSRYPDYIDHFVLDQRAAALMVPGSWGEMTYLSEHAAFEDQLSDHCPMFATFELL